MKILRVLQISSVALFAIVLAFTLPQFAFSQQLETPDFTSGDSSNIDPSSLSIPAKVPGLDEQVDVTVYPENPKPNEDVTITVNTYGIDINTNLIIWKLNGKEVLKGIGQKKYTFNVGRTGTVSKVDLSIHPSNGPVIDKSYSFTPVDVDILWQADTYTPPFYKGKALFTPESSVTVTALPNISLKGTKISPSDVVYKWKVNYDLDNDASGFGKNSYLFKGPIILKDQLIGAYVYAASTPEVQGNNQVNLVNSYPQAVLYEDNPLLGILFNKAISGSFNIEGNEVKIGAFPYYFSTKTKNDKVNYKWTLDDNTLDMPDFQNSTIFKRTDSEDGEGYMHVLIGNSSHILQQAGVGLGLVYSQ